MQKIGGISVERLKPNSKWYAQAALWADDKWGYIRGFSGVSKREYILKNPEFIFYMAFHNSYPIGMFALQIHKSLFWKSVMKLDYFYIAEPFRGLGYGKTLLHIAKMLVRDEGANMLFFETLNPNLDHFYEKAGAKYIADSSLLGQPTEIFRFIKTKE